jgi:carbamoyltransferase
MIYWGINALNHGHGLAVFKDDEFYDINHRDTDRLSSEQIQEAIDQWGMPDRIFWYENPWLKKARQIRAGQYATAFSLDNLPGHYLKQVGLGHVPVTYTPHHGSHAAAGYYTSPFNNCAIVVLDAIGEFDCASIWHAAHGRMKKIWSSPYPHSLGLFYSAFTKLIGLEPIKQEHLLQQMAAQGDPNRFYNQVKDYFKTGIETTRNLHRGVQDWPAPIVNFQDQCDIAAAVQHVFELKMHSIMQSARLLTSCDSVVYMGGCAFNSKANEYEATRWQHIWSLPDPGDGSSAIGAVLYHTKQRLWLDWPPVKHIAIKP